MQLCDKNANYTIDMSTITPSGAQPPCFGGPVNNDVWFTFTCTQTGSLEFQVTPTGAGANQVELVYAVYDVTTLGGCPTIFGSAGDPAFACNYNFAGDEVTFTGAGDPTGMGPISCVTCPTNASSGVPCEDFCHSANITAGNTYVIIVDFFTGGGAGTMDFQFLPGMTALIAPDASFTASPTIPVCGPSLTAIITDNSFGGTPTWE